MRVNDDNETALAGAAAALSQAASHTEKFATRKTLSSLAKLAHLARDEDGAAEPCLPVMFASPGGGPYTFGAPTGSGSAAVRYPPASPFRGGGAVGEVGARLRECDYDLAMLQVRPACFLGAVVVRPSLGGEES